MKKFKFSLQAVHDVREMRQEKEELVLSEKQNEVNKATARLAEIEKQHLEAIEKYSQKLKKGEAMNPFEMQINTNHIVSLDRSMREAKLIIEQKKQARTEQSQVVAAASREVKVTERLHETQKARHTADVERREQTAIDELVSANFARKMLSNK